MRLFIAIRLNEEMINGLMSVQSAFRQRHIGGHYTPSENLHVTLAFIGEYSDPEPVLNAMQTVPFRPFTITLDGFGNFNDLLWCGIGHPEELTACVKRLRRALAEEGIPFDRKTFAPHITLLRKASFDRSKGLPGITVPNVSMEVRSISLMRSDRGKHGMIYTEIGRADAQTEGESE